VADVASAKVKMRKIVDFIVVEFLLMLIVLITEAFIGASEFSLS
jgi:hypothetical protein